MYEGVRCRVNHFFVLSCVKSDVVVQIASVIVTCGNSVAEIKTTPNIYISLGQESCRTKVSRIFRYFVPNFPRSLHRIFPNFSRTFRASFRGRRRPEKIHQKSPPFFNVKFPGKHEKNIHKILLESRQSNISSLRRLHKGMMEVIFSNSVCRSFVGPKTYWLDLNVKYDVCSPHWCYNLHVDLHRSDAR